MRYVDDRRYDPRERLKEVLALCGGVASNLCPTARPVATGRGSARPLGVLDALFTGILERAARNAYPELEPEGGVLELASLVWTVIGLVPSRIAASAHPGESISLWVIEEALNRQSGDLARELSDLHSLLNAPQDMYGSKEVSVHHKSFMDFLGNAGRSGHLGNVAQVAEDQFDQTINTHLASLTVNDLKNLVLAQPVKPHILHHLHLLCDAETVIKSIDPKVWRALLYSLNTWETLLMKQWVFVALSHGPLIWDFRNSETLRMVHEASKRSLHNLPPGLENQRPPDPPPISDTDVELLITKIDGQEDENFECEHCEFIPKQRMGPYSSVALSSFPWFPAARALAWLWTPSHRLVTHHSRAIHPPNGPNSHSRQLSQIVFITGSAGSGKRELLEEAYRLLPAGKEDGPPEGWMPPVDIIIVPDTDGMSLRLLWMPGAFGEGFDAPCDNKDLMGRVTLLPQLPASLFQDWIRCWMAKHGKNTYHPQFLLQGLHLLSPEHQAALLDIIVSHAGPPDSTGRPPLCITVTGLLTLTLASRMRESSWPGVHYINLDGMKADVSLLENILSWKVGMAPSKNYKLAQILETSPKPARHLKRLLDHWWHNRDGWKDRLDTILAAPVSEAWQLIEEHFGEIPSDDDGW
ncbi:hypothetical protein FA13DRAFT_1797263 [Coprinellus micaceus]|uniref:Uncharacterized protein n=1 Tax=Coprinellus micaceus TaxID=71717 RepID=A0A4Y7SR86_COPMI|nr:hypothetical protein FA13DRAFT_1797263 [Coprinellus micaceus]